MADTVRDAISASIAGLSRLATTPVASGYGIDLVCQDDLDPALRETSSATIDSLAQDSYHRITTRRGLLPDDPDYGIDVLDYLSAGLTTRDLEAIPAVIVNEISKDDRVADATCTAATSADGATLTLTIDVEPADPALRDFTLIVAVADGKTLLELQKSP